MKTHRGVSSQIFRDGERERVKEKEGGRKKEQRVRRRLMVGNSRQEAERKRGIM